MKTKNRNLFVFFVLAVGIPAIVHLAKVLIDIPATTSPQPMRAYTKIIVEQQSAEHWTAWLEDYPQPSASCELPAGACIRFDTLAGNGQHRAAASGHPR